VGFVYTRCPIPEACPLAVAKMAAMADALPEGARLLAVTIDPAFDTAEVLRAYGERVGAKPGHWDFGRLDPESTASLAWAAALQVIDNGTTVEHANRWFVLGADGVLVERYDDHAWALDRVFQQLVRATEAPAR
jgi:protein SCO1/2